MPTKEPVYFKTNVLLKSIIGKDLINNDNIAILELVKNSYDANSFISEIIFKNVKENDDDLIDGYSDKSSKIIIRDEGNGMDEKDIINKWLNIAYSEKKYTKEENNRLLAGAKGVGRFSCDRLGHYLDIYTRKKGGVIIHLKINWKDFEVENEIGLEIQKIPNFIEEIEVEKFCEQTGYELFECGTILEISKLRSKWVQKEANKKQANKPWSPWNVDKIIELRAYLAKLIHPNQNFTNDIFKINLELSDFKDDENKLINEGIITENEKITGIVENLIFEKLDFTTTVIESKFINKGSQIETTLKDKDTVIFTLIEKNTDFIELKQLEELSINIYFLNMYSKTYFKKYTGIRSINYGSIFLFVNNFRISPLGDEGDDWLGVVLRSGQGRARFLSTRDIIGQIVVKDPNGVFQIVSNRQGIDDNDAFKELINININQKSGEKYKGFFYKTLKRLEKYVVDILNWDSPLSEEEKQSDTSGLNRLVSEFAKKVNSSEWVFDPDDEKYALNQEIKDKKVIEMIYSILSVKNENIVKLYINEKATQKAIDEKILQAKELVDELIEKLSFTNFSIEDFDATSLKIETAKQKLDTIDKEIQKVSSGLFSNEIINDASKTINELRIQLTHLKEELDKERLNKIKQNLEIDRLKKENEEKERELAITRENAKVIDEKLIKAESKNNRLIEENKNVIAQLDKLIGETAFAREAIKLNSKDLLISIKHNIGHSSKRISKYIQKLIILNENNDKKEKIEECIRMIDFENNKVISFVKYVNKVLYNSMDDKINHDIIAFINQYIYNAYNNYEDLKINNKLLSTSINNESKIEFILAFYPQEIIMLLDNLLDNSQKAKAKNVTIEWVQHTDSEVVLHYQDDGIGISDENIEKIFNFGFSTTRSEGGKGIGLYHVKTILSEINSSVSVNNKLDRGVEFIITFNKK